MNGVDRLIDRLVIRGDCLVEPCASDSWLKVRGVLVAGVLSLPGLAVSYYEPAGLLLALAGMFAGVKIVAKRINERIEYEGHTCGNETNVE